MMPRSSALASQVTAASTLMLLLLLIDGCGAKTPKTHKVGGQDAWGIPPASKPDVYLRWGKSAHVKLGDSLMFLYPPGHEDSVQVTARAIADCNVSAPLLRLADGNSVFNLTAPGRVYYTSTLPGHCQQGQRLTVDVPTAKGTHLRPSPDDLAALAAMAVLPAAAPPTEALPALHDGDSSAAPPPVAASAGAGPVLAAGVAALYLALLVVYKET